MNDNQPSEPRVYCAFLLDEHRFAVPVEDVKEVHALTSVTPIPGAPATVLGYVNLRGSLHLVIDPSSRLTDQVSTRTDAACFVVLRDTVSSATAMATGRILGMVTVDDHHLATRKGDASGGLESEDQLLIGFAQLDDGVYTLVDTRQLCQQCLQPLPLA